MLLGTWNFGWRQNWIFHQPIYDRILPEMNSCCYTVKKQVSNEQKPGCLGYLGVLPSYIGIIISHYKDPY